MGAIVVLRAWIHARISAFFVHGWVREELKMAFFILLEVLRFSDVL